MKYPELSNLHHRLIMVGRLMNQQELLLRKILRGLSGSSSPPEPNPPERPKPKDFWDKAGVIIGALSSIVLASAALLINSSIQQGQLQNATRASDAQRRAQNAKSTAELIQYLLSGDPPRQRMALIALRVAVQNDDDLIVDTIEVVASTTHDASVAAEATRALSGSKNPRVARILDEIYRNQKAPESIRNEAYLASQAVAVRATAKGGTVLLFGSQPGERSFEDPTLSGGVFTHFLIEALARKKNVVQGGMLSVEELSHSLADQFPSYIYSKAGITVNPVIESHGISGVPTSQMTVLSVGISKYRLSEYALSYGASDAELVGDTFRQRFGAKTQVLENDAASRAGVLEALDKASIVHEGTYVFYFSGHGWNIDGQQFLAAADLRLVSATSAETTTDKTVFPRKTRVEEPAETELDKPFVGRDLYYSPRVTTTPPNKTANGIRPLDFRRQNMISMEEIQSRLALVGAPFKIIIIDSCSTNPFSNEK